MQVIALEVANDAHGENMLQMLSQLEPLISIDLQPIHWLCLCKAFFKIVRLLKRTNLYQT